MALQLAVLVKSLLYIGEDTVATASNLPQVCFLMSGELTL
jgi:hypothetical protein